VISGTEKVRFSVPIPGAAGGPETANAPAGRAPAVCNTQPPTQITVTAITSTYALAPAYTAPAGFANGQAADLMLSGIDFDTTGGPLLFNHPAAITPTARACCCPTVSEPR
jgi:hypothetical protein